MKTRLARALMSLILPCLTACATGSAEAERAAKIRVTTSPDDVKGCQSLGVVTADGAYGDPIEAIRHAAARIDGADTAVLNPDVTPIVKQFRDTSGKPYVVSEVRGPIGQAYHCQPR